MNIFVFVLLKWTHARARAVHSPSEILNVVFKLGKYFFNRTQRNRERIFGGVKTDEH